MSALCFPYQDHDFCLLFYLIFYFMAEGENVGVVLPLPRPADLPLWPRGPSSQLSVRSPKVLHLLSSYLKVLSSEMDPAEIGLIRKVFIKERGAIGF